MEEAMGCPRCRQCAHTANARLDNTLDITHQSAMSIQKSCGQHRQCTRHGGWYPFQNFTSYMFIYIVISVLCTGICANPVSLGRVTRSKSHVTGAEYLSSFGYLPRSDVETGALRSDEELQNAIRRFQSYAHLPITGILDKATTDKMESPRCGMADREQFQSTPQGYVRNRRYVPGPSKWEKTHLTYRLRNYTPDLEVSKIRDSLERALQVWEQVTPLRFSEVTSSNNVDMDIIFASGYHSDGYQFDGPGLVLAHAFFPGEGTGGDLHFDEDETWTWGVNEGTNLFIVAAHEFGHAIGLSHSNVLGSLMYPWYQGYTPDFKLHPDDIAGVQYLYGYPSGVDSYDPYEPEDYTPGGPTRPVVTVAPTHPPRTQAPVRPTQSISTTPRSPDAPPDPCSTSLDAISIIRLEIFAFKGKWFWRINRETGEVHSDPMLISGFWYGLPPDLTHIDSVYERPGDGSIVFFSDTRYWLFNGNHRIPNFPQEGRPIYELGFPSDVKKVDAAFVWGYNSRTYFISGHMYWRYNEVDRKMDYDYPRDLSMWGGVPYPIDAVFQYYDKSTYFFSGLKYWKFNDARMFVHTKDYPRPVGDRIGCTSQVIQTQSPVGAASATASSLCSLATLMFIVLLMHCRH